MIDEVWVAIFVVWLIVDVISTIIDIYLRVKKGK